jgi:hypothetical protein
MHDDFPQRRLTTLLQLPQPKMNEAFSLFAPKKLLDLSGPPNP